MFDYAIDRTSESTARAFHMTWKPMGWAVIVIHEPTGVLSIISDWGNWSHRWDPRHLGKPSLAAFIAERNCDDYLACKLIRYGADRVVSAEKTKKRWREAVCERRREQRLTREHARQWWDAIEAWDVHESLQTGSFPFGEQDLDADLIISPAYEGFMREPSPEYISLTKTILPALRTLLLKTAMQATG